MYNMLMREWHLDPKYPRQRSEYVYQHGAEDIVPDVNFDHMRRRA